MSNYPNADTTIHDALASTLFDIFTSKRAPASAIAAGGYAPMAEKIAGELLTSEWLADQLRAAKAEGWDKCDSAWEAAHKMSHHEPWEYMEDGNPYRNENNKEAP